MVEEPLDAFDVFFLDRFDEMFLEPRREVLVPEWQSHWCVGGDDDGLCEANVHVSVLQLFFTRLVSPWFFNPTVEHVIVSAPCFVVVHYLIMEPLDSLEVPAAGYFDDPIHPVLLYCKDTSFGATEARACGHHQRRRERNASPAYCLQDLQQ